MEYILKLGVLVVFSGTVFGIFWTKTKGFGKYTTSALILTLVLFVASVAFLTGKLESAPIVNLLFSVAGFAGGLITARAHGSGES